MVGHSDRGVRGDDEDWRHAKKPPDLVAKRLWLHFFQEPVDTAPRWEYGEFREVVRKWFFKAEWFEVYDLLEALIAELDGKRQEALVSLLNSFLEQEMAAYRIVDKHVVEITSAEEIESIEAGLADAADLPAVRTHIKEAIAKLIDRKAPDYRNSIKESISAVEAMCQAITSDRSASLGQAVKRLKDAGVPLHGSLEQAWVKLYGYTSDAGGIRHALSDKSTISFADAKYMLVSCSAFVSYLVELARQAEMSLDPPV